MRIDLLLYEKGLYPSRNKAKESVLKGEVLYKGKVAKPSQEIDDIIDITIVKPEENFISNGGYKLSKAIKDFCFDVNGKVFADIGASNGGFTHCLLLNGASKVYAVDVGETQLDKSLRENEKVIIFDNTNARYLTSETFGEQVDGVVCDVSFISLSLILPSIKNILNKNGQAIVLIKPQFECGKEYLTKTGIVKSEKARFKAVEKIYYESINLGLIPEKFTVAPIKDKKNIEYLMLLNKNCNKKLDLESIKCLI